MTGGDDDGAARAALLAAIEAAPDAEAPRLIYADWLAQRGDPLGELLHAQLAIARLPAGDPALAELRAWERRILREQGGELAAKIHSRINDWRHETRFVLVHTDDPAADTRDDLKDPAPSGT